MKLEIKWKEVRKEKGKRNVMFHQVFYNKEQNIKASSDEHLLLWKVKKDLSLDVVHQKTWLKCINKVCFLCFKWMHEEC